MVDPDNSFKELVYNELLTALTQLRAELVSGKCQSDLKITDKFVESFHEVFCRCVKQSDADTINVLWRKLSVRFHPIMILNMMK